jgi:TetR/AcrR family transcriptional repressor of mexJK operon
VAIAMDRGQAKAEQIRAAAQSLFLRHGFSGTSTDAIAAEASVSKQTLYRYFRSKEALLADCLQELIERQAFDGALVATDDLVTRDKLRESLVQMTVQLTSALMQPQYLDLARVVIAEAPRQPHLGKLFSATVVDPVISGVAALLKQAHDAGLVDAPEADADAAARLLVGGVLTYTLPNGLLSGDSRPRRPPRSQLVRLVDLHLKAIAPPPNGKENQP